jgi:hypothetical protein
MADIRPDSDFQYRILSSVGGRRLTWHTLDCRTGKNAKYSRRTIHTPESRREKAEAAGRVGYPTDHMAKCCLGKGAVKAGSETEKSPSFSPGVARKIFANALAAGRAAGEAAEPTPMVVGTPTTFLGNDIDYTKRTYYVPDGVCGFAWVVIRPGNSSLARQAVKLDIGSRAYGGGISIWVDEHGHSLDRKQRHAHAYADVLRAYGVNAYAQSRLD